MNEFICLTEKNHKISQAGTPWHDFGRRAGSMACTSTYMLLTSRVTQGHWYWCH